MKILDTNKMKTSCGRTSLNLETHGTLKSAFECHQIRFWTEWKFRQATLSKSTSWAKVNVVHLEDNAPLIGNFQRIGVM